MLVAKHDMFVGLNLSMCKKIGEDDEECDLGQFAEDFKDQKCFMLNTEGADIYNLKIPGDRKLLKLYDYTYACEEKDLTKDGCKKTTVIFESK